MELILLERIERLGNVGDKVTVKAGYGRNFLVPRGKAVAATSANEKMFARRRDILVEKEQGELEQAKAMASTLEALSLSLSRATSDGENLYGSISTADLASMLSEAGHEIERRQIILDDQIRAVGEHPFRVRLHPDVTAELKIDIQAEGA